MKRLLYLILALAANLSAQATSWQEKVDTIWPACHYRELNGISTGSQHSKTWIDWKHAEGTVLVYGIHFPTGHVRADAVFTAKSGMKVSFGVRIVHPATGTVVLDDQIATSTKTSTAEQTMEIMPETEMPYDGWYRFELTCPNGVNTLDHLNLLTFQRTSTQRITDSEIFMAPSVHLWWDTTMPGAPSGQGYNWTYLEAMYPSAYKRHATYQMTIGTDVGYSGIQMPTRSDGSYGHSVLFSVWDEGDVDQDRNLPDNMRAAAVDVGPGAYATRFGGEGTGSSIRYNDDNLWQFDHWIQFLMNERPETDVVTITDDNGKVTTKEYQSTLQSMWFKDADNAEWRYIGTLRRTGENRLTPGIYSFLENFADMGGNLMRRCYFRNGAMRAAATGEWFALNHAGYGHTQDNGNRYSRYDYGHGVTGLFDNTFYLETGGYMGRRDSVATYEAPEHGQMPWVDTIDIERLTRRIDLAVTRNRAKTVRSLVEATRTVSDPATWALIGYSDEETVGEGDFGRAEQMLDGSTSTYYHNKWKNGSVSFPHTFSFDAGVETTISSIELYQSRDSGYRAKQVQLYTSETGATWRLAATGLSIEDSDHPTIELPEPITSRYFRLRFTAGYGSNLVINELYFKHEYRLPDLLTLAKRLLDEADQYGGYAPSDLDAICDLYADGNGTDIDALRQAIEALGDNALPLTYGTVAKAEHFTPLAVYQFHNLAGHGDLIATADGQPSLAGATIKDAKVSYCGPSCVTDSLCNWLLLHSRKFNDYYLYNLGLKQFLSIDAEGAISLSDLPASLSFSANGNGYVIRYKDRYLGFDATADKPLKLVSSAGANAIFQLRTNHAMRVNQEETLAFTEDTGKALHEDNSFDYLFQQGLQTYAKAFVGRPNTRKTLIRSTASLTSNCNTTQQEAHDLAKIIDGSKATYYETWYSGIEWPAEMPYLQARLTSPISAFCFTFSPSTHPDYGQTDIPTDIIVYAASDNKDFLPVARLDEGLPTKVTESYTSPVIFCDSETRDFRFQVMETYGKRADSHVFAMSEFQMHPVTIDEDASPYYTKSWVKTAFDALQAQLQTIRPLILANSAKPADAQALREAIARAEEALLIDGISAPESSFLRSANRDASRLKNHQVFDLSGRRRSLGTRLPAGIYLLRDGNQHQKVVIE